MELKGGALRLIWHPTYYYNLLHLGSYGRKYDLDITRFLHFITIFLYGTQFIFLLESISGNLRCESCHDCP